MKLNFHNISKLLKEELIYIFIPILIALFYYIIYRFRMDDFTILFSWRWVHQYFDFWKIATGFFASIIIAYVVSSIQISLKKIQYLLVIFGLSLFIIIPFWIVPEINPDTSRFFTQAKYLEMHGVVAFISNWGGDLFVHYDQPSPSLIYGLLFKFFGENRSVIQAFNTLLFGLGIVATFLIGKKLWNEHVGLYGSLFLMSFPHLIVQVPLMLVDSFSMCTLAIAVLGFLLAIKEFRIHWIIVFLTFSIVTITSKLTIPIIFVFVILAAGLLYSSRKSEYRNVILLLVFLSAILILIVSLEYDVLLSQLNRVSRLSPLEGATWRYAVSPISMFHQLSPAVVVLFLISPLFALKLCDKRFVILLAWIIPIIIVVGSSRLRYLIPIYPAIALAAGYTIYELIKNTRLRQHVVACIMLFSVIIGFSYIPFMQSYDSKNLMDAATYAENQGFQEIAIVTYFPNRQGLSHSLIPIFDYYYSGNLIPLSNIADIFNETQSEQLPDILIIIARHDFNPTTWEEITALMILETRYELVKRFDSATMGYWSPAITTIYKRLSE